MRVNNASITRSVDLGGYDVATLNIRLRSVADMPAGAQFIVEVAASPSGPFTALQIFSGSVAPSDRSYVLTPFLGPQTTIRFRVDNTQGVSNFYALDFVEVRALTPACFEDTFSDVALNATDWGTNSVSGSFGQPRIVNGRLRLTDASGNVSTAATLRRFFPGADNRVVVEFDYLAYGGSGADGVAVTLSDGNVTPVAGGFGGSLGYAQRSGVSGFAGGWLGVGLDEFGNFSNPTEARVGGPGSRRDAVALRGSGSGTSGYRYLAGTATLSPGIDISGNTPGPNHRYRITVDNRFGVVPGALVSVERNTGSGFSTLVAPFNIFEVNPAQAGVPENFRLSLTGSTGGSTNIHELDNVRVCATRINQLVEVDHFRFFHDGQGLTCGPESIVVQACLDPNCTQQVSGPIQVTLSPSGWVGGDTQTIVSGQTLSLRRTSPGNVTLAVTASNPPRRPFTPDRCFVGGVQQANCSFNFADSGFSFDIPNHDADALQSVVLSAVRRDNITQACVPGFANVTRSIAFGSAYQNPTTGTTAVRVNSTAVANGGAPTTALPLAFDANGRATIAVQYADAGSMRLLARYTGSAANGDAGLVMSGQDDFVAKPILHLEITSPSNAAAADATGGVFTVAGLNFATRVTARNVNGVVTPNFGRETVTPPAVAPAEPVQLRSTLVAPLGGNNPAPVGSLGAAINGVLTGNWRWDDVGIIGLAAHLVDNDYLGAGDLSRPASAILPRVGRFVPRRLAVAVAPGVVPAFAPSCAAGSFGYSGQAFGFASPPQFSVTALNVQGSTTQNYVNSGSSAAGRFWKLGGTLVGRTYSSTASPIGVLTVTTAGAAYAPVDIAAAPFDGTGVLQPSDPLALDRLTYAKPATPEAPFAPQVTMTLPADDLTDSDGRCHDPDDNGTCDPFSLTGITGSVDGGGQPWQMRWGRIAVTNAYGPELIDLRVPMRAEYFNGTTFITNTDDACSGVTLQPLVDANAADSLVPAHTCVHDSGSPGSSGQGCAAGGPPDRRYTLTPAVGGAGNYTLWLRSPGVGNVGILDLTANVPDWLRFDWRGTGPVAPTARVGFGVYQGDQRAIHQREVY